MIENRTSLEF